MDAQCFHVHCQAITAHWVEIEGGLDCDAYIWVYQYSAAQTIAS